jgi:hypothetical protein
MSVVAVEFDHSFTDHGLSLAYDTYGSSDAPLVGYLHTGTNSSQCASIRWVRDVCPAPTLASRFKRH